MYLFDIMLFDISLYIFFKLSEFPLVTKLVRYVFWDWGLIFFVFNRTIKIQQFESPTPF
jgi:hypothetical protein